MKFRIEREDWLPALQMVLGAVDRKQAVPVLGNLLVQATGDEVVVWGTDLELEVRATTPALVEREGETTVPARKLWEIWRNLPVSTSGEFTASGARATVKTGSGRFSLATLGAEGFPVLPSFEPAARVEMPTEGLRGVLEGTHFAMAQQDVRFYLNGLLLEIHQSGLRAVATDGHRLALCETDATTHGGDLPVQAIVPRKAVVELLRMLSGGASSVRIEVGAQALRATMGGWRLSARLVEGRFPEYERVIPDPDVWDKHVVAEREVLRQALIRAAILANERYRAVRLSLSRGRLKVQAENAEKEEAEEDLGVLYEGPALDIGFNVTYLVEAVAAVRAELVRICLQDEGSSCLIQGEDLPGCRYVVMPMRL